ncbi:hypothetical protein F2Q69_00024597 [Brassica cretica]|uniref:Myb-like domain-containing protein n=1 Tax=Brassica cretica TaxID=69181 RepID=A0A8S9Q4C3_BRACR|nr:hypothetical protein F2Q69_00024597 [Brassica cretica]
MVRPPCCDKEGVKKGPWTPEEDIILVTYIQEHGPGNWRAVPTNTGAFQSFSGFDHLKDRDSAGVSPDHETKPDITGYSNQSQWSLFEKWLFEDSGGQVGDILLDENPNFF